LPQTPDGEISAGRFRKRFSSSTLATAHEWIKTCRNEPLILSIIYRRAICLSECLGGLCGVQELQSGPIRSPSPLTT
jgi:hypothetical protein